MKRSDVRRQPLTARPISQTTIDVASLRIPPPHLGTVELEFSRLLPSYSRISSVAPVREYVGAQRRARVVALVQRRGYRKSEHTRDSSERKRLARSWRIVRRPLSSVLFPNLPVPPPLILACCRTGGAFHTSTPLANKVRHGSPRPPPSSAPACERES